MRRFPEQLPAPVVSPPSEPGAALARLSKGGRQLLDGLMEGRPLFWLGPAGTRKDVGWWFRKARVWVAVFETEVVLLAHGERPFVERAPMDDLGESQYNVVTGELVLEPAPSLSLRKLVLSPVEAGQVLSQIRK
jgi:hypothetical protein